MRVEIDRGFALKLYCYARQAERSVDFALTGPGQWTLLREYYTPERRQALNALGERLRPIVPSDQPVLPREHFGKADFIWLLLRPITLILNHAKRTWRFAHTEVRFLTATFDSLLETLSKSSPPPASLLIELRMNLLMCEWIIARRLEGVTELQKASEIEHFCQSAYTRHVTMEELGVN